MRAAPDSQTIAALLRETLAQGAQPRLRVTSSSMAPCLRPGDQVLVAAAQAEHLRLGDILVIQRQGDLLTHRLVASRQGNFRTKGDGEALLDAPCSPAAILGRVAAIERGPKRLDLERPLWRAVNPILGRLGGWEARLYAISPLARLPIWLITRIIVWVCCSLAAKTAPAG